MRSFAAPSHSIKRLAQAALLLAVTAPTASAQTSASAPVNVSIITALSVRVTGATNFGSVSDAPHVETIDPRAPITGQTTASFLLTAQNGRNVIISCPTSLTLAGPSGSSLIFTPNIAAGVQGAATAQLLPSTACPSFSVQIPGGWTWYLGGSIDVPNGVVPGAYSGTYMLSVAY